VLFYVLLPNKLQICFGACSKKKMDTNQPAEESKVPSERKNTLDDLTAAAQEAAYSSQQVMSQGWTLGAASHGAIITLDRMLLAESYMKQGLVQTLVAQPVEDAFQGGFEIVSGELSPDEISELNDTLYSYEWSDDEEGKQPRYRETSSEAKDVENDVIDDQKMRTITYQSATARGQSDIETIKEVAKWGRLFGGGGLIINTESDFKESFSLDDIKKGDRIEFLAADRWELILSATNVYDRNTPTPFNYYGFPLNRSRVIMFMGERAPSYVRQRLQGWGMSEVERCIRPINAFVKFESMLFELVDEAKIDVYNIQGFNDSLGSAQGTELIRKRMFLANSIKNYQNGVVMDAEDHFDHKQIAFGGLAEIWDQLRVNLSSALRIPMNKLFGQSASGFSSGQDSIENYNSIVEGVRQRVKPLINEAIKIRCMQLFGYVPDFHVRFKPLKVLSGLEEEQVLDLRQNRVLGLADRMFLTSKETMTMLRQQGVLTVETDAEKGLRDPIGDKELAIDAAAKMALTPDSPDKGGAGNSSRSKRGPISTPSIPSTSAKAKSPTPHAKPVSKRSDSR